MKIKFYTDDDLPLNKSLKLCMLTIIVRSVFEESGKFYLQVYLDGLTELKSLKEMILIKLINKKNLKSVITAILAMVLNMIQKFIIDVTGE